MSLFVQRLLSLAILVAFTVVLATQRSPVNWWSLVVGVTMGSAATVARLWWLATHDRRYSQEEIRSQRFRNHASRGVRIGAIIGVMLATFLSSAGIALHLPVTDIGAGLGAFLTGGMLVVVARPNRNREIRL